MTCGSWCAELRRRRSLSGALAGRPAAAQASTGVQLPPEAGTFVSSCASSCSHLGIGGPVDVHLLWRWRVMWRGARGGAWAGGWRIGERREKASGGQGRRRSSSLPGRRRCRAAGLRPPASASRHLGQRGRGSRMGGSRLCRSMDCGCWLQQARGAVARGSKPPLSHTDLWRPPCAPALYGAPLSRAPWLPPACEGRERAGGRERREEGGAAAGGESVGRRGGLWQASSPAPPPSSSLTHLGGLLQGVVARVVNIGGVLAGCEGGREGRRRAGEAGGGRAATAA